MPRTKPLTAQSRLEQLNQQCNDILSRRLRGVRAELDETMEEFSERLDIDRQTYRRWVQRPGIIELDKLRRVARVLNLSREDWLRIGGYDA